MFLPLPVCLFTRLLKSHEETFTKFLEGVAWHKEQSMIWITIQIKKFVKGFFIISRAPNKAAADYVLLFNVCVSVSGCHSLILSLSVIFSH